MNAHPAKNRRTQDGKSPVGPGTTQIRGFRGMPTPEEVPVKMTTSSVPQTAPEVQNPQVAQTSPAAKIDLGKVSPSSISEPQSSEVEPLVHEQVLSGDKPSLKQTPLQAHSITKDSEASQQEGSGTLSREALKNQVNQPVSRNPLAEQREPLQVQKPYINMDTTSQEVQKIKQVSLEKKVESPKKEVPPQQQPVAGVPRQSSASAYAQNISQAPEQVFEKKARPAVRTFKNDATSYIKDQNITDVQIALAEQKRQQARSTAELTSAPSSRKIWIILFTTLLLLVGVAVFAVVYLKPDLSFFGISRVAPESIPQSKLESLTGSSEAEYLPLDTDLSYAEIDLYFDRLLRKENSAYLFVEDTFDGREEFIFPDSFFQYTRMYDLQDIAFAFRNIEYGARNGSPYLLLEASDFPKVYPRIFTWEEQMVRQIEPLFPKLRQREIVSTVVIDAEEETEPIEVIEDSEEERSSENGSGIVSGENSDLSPKVQASESPEIIVEEEEDSAVDTENAEEESGEEPSKERDAKDSLTEEDVTLQEKIITDTIDYRDLPFKDALYENQSIRIILDEKGQSTLYHTFIGDRYVLIAQDLDLIPEILEALR